MRDYTVFIVFFAVAPVLAAIVIPLFLKSSKKRRRQMERLGELCGLKITGGEPLVPGVKFLQFLKKELTLEGEIEGKPVKIFHYSVGQKNKTTYVTARVTTPNPRGLSFAFSREGFLSKIGKAVGMEDVQLGDPDFDKKFIIKCNDPDFIITAITYELKQKFLSVYEDNKAPGTVNLEGEELSYTEKGTLQNEKMCQRFAAVVDILLALSKTYT